MFCLNLCDFFYIDIKSEKNIDNYLVTLEAMLQKKINRIYFGSYFCDLYFLKFKAYYELIQYCKSKNIQITLVLPVFSQNMLEIGKKRILEVCRYAETVIDEITVNDLGMLNFISKHYNHKINLGRLFFKNPRDCRVPEYIRCEVTPGLLSELNGAFFGKYTINCVELDPTNQILNVSELAKTNIKLVLHSPYCYMTTGKICKFASIHQHIEKKFRPNVNCRMECMHITDTYSGHIVPTDCDPIIYRLGRTLYFENGRVETNGKCFDRLLYFPVKEWRKILYESFSSCK